MGILASLLGGALSAAGSGVNALASSSLQQYYNKKNMRSQFEYKMRELREAPTNFRKGMEEAGYNPLLALPTGISSSGVSSSNPSVSMDLVSGAKQGALMAAEIKKANAEAEQVELTNQGIESQNKILKAEARNADSVANAKGVASELQSQRDYAEFSALGGSLPTIIVPENSPHPFENERFSNYVQKILNEIDSSAYKANKNRVIIKDAIDGASSLLDLANGVKGMKGNPKQAPKPLLKRRIKWKNKNGDNYEDYEYL